MLTLPLTGQRTQVAQNSPTWLPGEHRARRWGGGWPLGPPGGAAPILGLCQLDTHRSLSSHLLACTQLSAHPREGTPGPCSMCSHAEESGGVSGKGGGGPEGCRKDRRGVVDLTKDQPLTPFFPYWAPGTRLSGSPALRPM